MMAIEHRNDHQSGAGYVVRRPRATDALGAALRHAYGEAHGLPDDIIGSLIAIDRATSRH